MRVGSLFAGYGGIDLGLSMVWPDAHPAWFVEFDKHPSAILAKHWPDVPNYGDITTVDWSTVEPVDVLTGGFPCQDVSHAGNRAGIKPGTRSGLWSHMAYAIAQLRPRLVVIENVRGLLSAEAHSDLERDCWCVGDERDSHLRALGAVLGDLAAIGFDAEWTSVRASDAGAPHRRERVFIVAADAGRGQLPRPAARADGLPVAAERGSEPDVTLLPTPTVQQGRNETAGRRPDAKFNTGTTLNDVAYKDDFGPYTAAIRRWEAVLEEWEGVPRPAPSPTEPNRAGRPRLSPRFVEFMMGLPDGWVTDAGIPRNAQLKALGNGVVPQQLALALTILLPRLGES